MRQPDILEYLPAVLNEIREIKAYANAENPELSKLWGNIENVYDDQYLYTMTENGVLRWEKMLRISPKGTDSLEDRRFRIINRLNAKLPYTYRMLEMHLNRMCGENGYVMRYEKEIWTLIIKVELSQKKQYDEILKFVKEIIPANIILDYGLLYNKHEDFTSYTHGELASYIHSGIRSDVFA